MSTSAVVGFRDNPQTPPIWLFLHNGEDRLEKLADAIEAARPRWNHASYATRICVSRMTQDAWDSELGYGLSVGSYSIPTLDRVALVDWSRQTVSLKNSGDLSITYRRLGFEDFLESVPFADLDHMI